MKARDRVLLVAAAVLALSASECNAFQSDVHYGATFAIAVATGWSWDQAGLIAGANQATDENIDTRPSIQISEASSSTTPGGRNSATALASTRLISLLLSASSRPA